MLRTASARFAATSAVAAADELSIPLLRVFGTLGDGRGPALLGRRARFCYFSTASDSVAVAAKAADAAVVEGEADVKASFAITHTNPQMENSVSVIALPLLNRPLFPGFYMPINVKDQEVLQALEENRKRSVFYAGAFLVKDEECLNSEKTIDDLKGKDLLRRLHTVGTLAQITSIQGDQIVLLGHRRLQITDMDEGNPLKVKFHYLKEKPYRKDNDLFKATSFDVLSTLREVLSTSSLWKDHVKPYTERIGDFNYPRLADFGAAISGANKLLCQEVLEELDVYRRLKLTHELVKKEMEIMRLQQSIARAIEQKITGDQRHYLLNDQFKAIKKDVALETDEKKSLYGKFKERIESKKDKWPAHVLQLIHQELTKFLLLEASSNEFNVTRNYLDWLTVLPWENYCDENFSVHHALEILDKDHCGMTDVKERILELIAVGKLRGTFSRVQHYFTPTAIEGTELDTRNCSTLDELFQNSQALCFDNHKGSSGVHDFSNFSKDIFKKLITISYQQGRLQRFFELDYNQILVRHIGQVVLDVAIPTSQIVDPKVKSIYKDRIVGPFARLLFHLYMKLGGDNLKKKLECCYKEICDLLHKSIISKQWWASLGELLCHPLFLTSEQKMAFLFCMHVWIHKSKAPIPHGISGVQSRVRIVKLNDSAFRVQFAQMVYFRRDYSLTRAPDGEVMVSYSLNSNSWKSVFIVERCFGINYPFGNGKGKDEWADMIDFCRHILAHFEDENFTAYARKLDRATIKMAITHLDRRSGKPYTCIMATKFDLSVSAPVHKEKIQFLGPNVDRHGIHEIRGPLMVGGVEFLSHHTHLFRDLDVRQMLTSKQRFQAYLQFREQAFKIAAAQLVAAFNSPADLFLFTAEDGWQFLSDYMFHQIIFCDTALHSIIVDNQSNEIGDDNNLPTAFASVDEHSEIDSYKKKKESLLLSLHYIQRYFVYRKGLMKLNIGQFNNDFEKALEWLKSSTGWSELSDYELRSGLESHMNFLEEHEISKMYKPSIPESESVALERINAEVAKLEKNLDISDWALIVHYYNRMKLRSLARVCSIEAQATGVYLVKQALPVREICKEQILSTNPGVSLEGFMKRHLGGFINEAMMPSLMGRLGALHQIQEKFAKGVTRRMAFLFIPVAAVAAVAMPDIRR